MTRLIWYAQETNENIRAIAENLVDFRIGTEVVNSPEALKQELQQICNATLERSTRTYSDKEITPFIVIDLAQPTRTRYANILYRRFSYRDSQFPFYVIPIHTKSTQTYFENKPCSNQRAAREIAEDVKKVTTSGLSLTALAYWR